MAELIVVAFMRIDEWCYYLMDGEEIMLGLHCYVCGVTLSYLL